MGTFPRQWAYLLPQFLPNFVDMLLGNGGPHSEQRLFWKGHSDKLGRLNELGPRGALTVGTKAFTMNGARMDDVDLSWSKGLGPNGHPFWAYWDRMDQEYK